MVRVSGRALKRARCWGWFSQSCCWLLQLLAFTCTKSTFKFSGINNKRTSIRSSSYTISIHLYQCFTTWEARNKSKLTKNLNSVSTYVYVCTVHVYEKIWIPILLHHTRVTEVSMGRKIKIFHVIDIHWYIIKQLVLNNFF